MQQTNQMVNENALPVLRQAARTVLDVLFESIDKEVNRPLRMFASNPLDSKLHFGANVVQASDGSAKTNPPVDDVHNDMVETTLDFQSGAVSPSGNILLLGSTYTPPSSTTGYYRRAVFVYRSDGKVDSNFSDSVSSYNLLEDSGTLFGSIDGIQLGWVDLVGTSTAVSGSFKSASSTGNSATNIIENAVSGGSCSVFNQSVGGSGGAGDTSFKLQSINGSTVTIKKGKKQTGRKEILFTGNVTTDTPSNIDIDLASILASPLANTTYWLYVDKDKLEASYELTDSHQIVRRVYDYSHFMVSALRLDQVNPYRYMEVGSVRTPGTATWVGSTIKTAPSAVHMDLSSFYPYVRKVSQRITSAVDTTITHSFNELPTGVELWFWDNSASKRTPLMASTHVSNSTTTQVSILVSGLLTFDSGDYLDVDVLFSPKLSDSFASASHRFVSPWYENTSTPSEAHGMPSIDDIAGYCAQEWNVTTGKRRLLELSSMVSGFDGTSFYYDWSGITPSSTLKYRVISGSSALPHAGPIAKRNVFTFTALGQLTESTSGYEVELPDEDAISDIRAIQKYGNRWVSATAAIQSLCGVEPSGSKWYLRGNVDVLAPSALNPLKIICQPHGPVIVEETSDPLADSVAGSVVASEKMKLISDPGTVGQIRLAHVLGRPSFRSLLLDPTKLSFWNLSEDINDEFGSRNMTTNVGSTPFTGTNIFGVANKAANLNGTSQGFYNSSSVFNPGGTVDWLVGVLAAATDWTRATVGNCIVFQGGGSDRSFQIFADDVGNIIFNVTNTAGVWDYTITVPNPGFVDGSWHHFAMRYDSVEDILYAYIDGKKVGLQTGVTAIRAASTPALYFGIWGGISNWFGGKMQDAFFGSNLTFTDHDVRKLASARIDHNKNLISDRQNWIVNHYPLGADPATPINDAVVDKSDANSVFMNFVDLAPTDKVDYILQDIGLENVTKLPIQNAEFLFTATGLLTSGTSDYPTNLADDMKHVEINQLISGEWKPKDKTLVGVTNTAPRYLRGNIDSLSPSVSNPVRIIVSSVAPALALSEATSTSSGLMGYLKQVFGGLKQFLGGISSVEYVGTEFEGWTSGTHVMLPTHKRVQNVNPAAARTVNLPTTVGDNVIKAGEKVKIQNRSTYLVSVQSSGGNSIDAIYKGYIELTALVDAPSTASDWNVSEVSSYGTFTPTQVSTNSNVDSLNHYPATFSRNGNIVQVSGQVDVDTTAAANTLTVVRMSIPFGSDFTNIYNANGVAARQTTPNNPGSVAADATNNCAFIQWYSGDTTNVGVLYNYSYVIK